MGPSDSPCLTDVSICQRSIVLSHVEFVSFRGRACGGKVESSCCCFPTQRARTHSRPPSTEFLMTVDLWSKYSTVCPVCPACVPAPPSVFLRTDHKSVVRLAGMANERERELRPIWITLRPFFRVSTSCTLPLPFFARLLVATLLQHEYGTGGRRTDGMAASARISQCQKFAQEVDAVDALLANICRFSIGSKCSAVDSTATPSPPCMHQRMRVFIRWRLR